MQRNVISFLVIGLLLGVSSAHAQVKKQFSVEGDANVEQINLKFAVNSGICSIKAGDGDESVTVYSNQDYDNYNHSFNKSISGKVATIDLSLEDKVNPGISQSISRSVFGSKKDIESNLWRVYLNRNKIYTLDLVYGLGQADIDLSGVAVRNLKVHTGSADINVGYFSELENSVQMDTFYVKVDMGTIAVKQLNHANSKFVKADVGFGDLLLDMTGKNSTSSSVHGSVGAGNLYILLPNEQTPMIVRVHDSWLCQVKLSKSFKPYGKNTFVNEAFSEDAENLISFFLDVSMGNIIFKER
ncbi:hypothetical protein [Fulvivirga sedimenti]|uniref:Adhesin domain-containing protein n=1 Tax=Fulvivirga sedimenti TaxID=2879465 RepID=A0A9X1HXA9_9BACT|nr:hypothetical protein [Fulvivirga sedimenti]MCA6078164.1 hypothetical protein [Fulvivirga sedimenti]